MLGSKTVFATSINFSSIHSTIRHHVPTDNQRQCLPPLPTSLPSIQQSVDISQPTTVVYVALDLQGYNSLCMSMETWVDALSRPDRQLHLVFEAVIDHGVPTARIASPRKHATAEGDAEDTATTSSHPPSHQPMVVDPSSRKRSLSLSSNDSRSVAPKRANPEPP